MNPFERWPWALRRHASLRLAGGKLPLWALAVWIAACQAVAGIEQRTEAADESDSERCRAYCSDVTSACVAESAVYHSERQCRFVCAKLSSSPLGTKSIECRHQAVQVMSSESSECWVAGPGGKCDGNCASYCALMSQACADNKHSMYWLSDVAACTKACRALRDLAAPEQGQVELPFYSAGDESSRDHNGDTVQCRLFHASAAAEGPSAAANHCWHAALSPYAESAMFHFNPCLGKRDDEAPSCEDYCRVLEVACDGDLKVYKDTTQCLRSCESLGLEPGARTDGEAGRPDTLACRMTQAYKALVSGPDKASEYCGKASAAGDGACGSRCSSYCAQLSSTCGMQPADCEAACKQLPNKDQAYSLDLVRRGTSPFACRIHALVEARADPSLMPTKCSAALVGCP